MTFSQLFGNNVGSIEMLDIVWILKYDIAKHPQVYRPTVNWSVTPLGSSLQDSGQVFETVLKSLLPI